MIRRLWLFLLRVRGVGPGLSACITASCAAYGAADERCDDDGPGHPSFGYIATRWIATHEYSFDVVDSGVVRRNIVRLVRSGFSCTFVTRIPQALLRR